LHLVKDTWNDQAWLTRFRDPNQRESAFYDLVNHHQKLLYPPVFRLSGNHEDTHDILQETFIKAWKHFPGFQEKSKISTWLYSIAIREALSFLKMKKRSRELRGDMPEMQEKKSFTAEEGNDLTLKLYEAIRLLPEKQRAVFVLKYFDELPYAEISGIMGTTEGALKASYFHAVKKVEAFILND